MVKLRRAKGSKVSVRKKRLNHRRKFKAHGDNPLKTYRRKLTDYQVAVRAECSRQNRLAHPTYAELACEKLLTKIGEPFEREKIFQNGDRFILVDFFIPRRNLAIEVDGSVHGRQAGYDMGRDLWLLSRGVATLRLTNKEVVDHPEETEIKLRETIL